MDMEDGEYLIISSCIKGRYDSDKIYGLIQAFDSIGATFETMDLLKANPETVDYSVVWEGVEELSSPFSEKLLSRFVLSALELRFDSGIPARLQVMFLDKWSYEVSLLFNYDYLIDGENDTGKITSRFKLIESIALMFFEKLIPLYGTIGVERGVEGIGRLIEDVPGLPCDKVYYNKQFINKSPLILNFIQEAAYSYENNAGVYFRNSRLEDFQYVEDEKLMKRLNEELIIAIG